jgi:hypothetical protein
VEVRDMRVVDKNEIKRFAIERLKEKIEKNEKITLYWIGESLFSEDVGKLDCIEANDLVIKTNNVMFFSDENFRDIKDIVEELEKDLSKIKSVNFVVKVIKRFDTEYNYCFVCNAFNKTFKIKTSVIDAFKKKARVFKETNYYWCFLELCDEIFELDEKDIVDVIVEILL